VFHLPQHKHVARTLPPSQLLLYGEAVMGEHQAPPGGILLQGSGVRIQDGVPHEVKSGDFWQTPGNVSHGFVAGPQGAFVLDIFSPPRDEYRKAGAGLSE
jgi:quercetin dioxygenase-like cupin family protein